MECGKWRLKIEKTILVPFKYVEKLFNNILLNNGILLKNELLSNFLILKMKHLCGLRITFDDILHKKSKLFI